jgi:membrane protein DedA with SNARE-associated domain
VLLEHVLQWITQYGYAAIFFLLVFGIVGLPIPDETMLTFVGYLIFKGRMHYFPALAAAFLGSITGITISYFLGRSLGPALVQRYGRYIHLTQEKLDHVEEWFQRIGHWALTFGYFIPGVRHFTAYVAGASGLPYREFALYAYSGGILWSVTFISLGYFFGERWDWVLERMHGGMATVVIFGGGAVVSYFIFRKLFKRKK